MIQHCDGDFTLKSGRHGERKLRDQLRLRAAPACRRHVQDRIAAVDMPAARMIIASLTLVLEPALIHFMNSAGGPVYWSCENSIELSSDDAFALRQKP